MKLKWIIEDFDADNRFDVLAEEAKKQGHIVDIIKYVPFQSGSYNNFGNNDCVVTNTSINLAKQLQREKEWIPGPWLNSRAYECTSYYAYLGKYHINSDYVMLPRSEVERNLTFLRKSFGSEEGALFIRPSSGHKTFTGKVFHEKSWKSDWEWVEEFTDKESIVIISSPKTIVREWRFIAAEEKIITGSLYREKIGPISSEKYREIDITNNKKDVAAQIKAEDVLSEKYLPDPVFVIDICEDINGDLYLLEIGSFCCAGLYNCNVSRIVEVVSKIALKEWKDFSNV